MIYSYKGFASDKKCFLGYERPNGTYVTIRDVLESRFAYEELTKMCNASPVLYVSQSIPEIGLPDYVQTTETDVDNYDAYDGDIQRLYDVLLEMSESIDFKFHNTFKKITPLDDVGMDVFRQHVSSVSRISDGVMTSPKDPLLMSVPNYSELVSVYSEDIRKNYNPDAEDAEDEDADVSGQTSRFVDSVEDINNLGQQAILRDFQSLNPIIDKKHFFVDKAFPYYNSIRFKDILRLEPFRGKIPESYIEGNPDNNTIGIQENEQEYFNALVDLIREGIARENDLVTFGEIDAAVAQNKQSKIVDSYLQDLAEMAFSLNWTHTGAVLITDVVSIQDEDGEGDDEAIGRVPGYYTVTYDPSTRKTEVKSLSDEVQNLLRNNQFISGMSAVRRYVNAHVSNSYKWAYALIRLLRWGERKPSKLFVENKSGDVQEYLDLNSKDFAIVTFSGSLNDCQPELTADGSEYYLDYLIAHEYSEISYDELSSIFGVDLRTTPRIPLGVLLRKNYKGTNVIGLKVVDTEAFVEGVMDGSITVQGLSKTLEYTGEPVDIIDSNKVSTSAFDNAQLTFYKGSRMSALGIILTKDYGIKPEVIRNTSAYQSLVKFMKSLPAVAKASLNLTAEDVKNGVVALSNITSEDVVAGAFANLVIPAYLELSSKVENLEDIGNVLKTAYAVFEADKSRTRTASRNVQKGQANPAFSAYIEKCQKMYSIVKQDASGASKIIAYFGQYIENGATRNLFASAEDYTPKIKPSKSLSAEMFLTKVYAPALKHLNENYDKFINKSIIFASDNTTTAIKDALQAK